MKKLMLFIWIVLVALSSNSVTAQSISSLRSKIERLEKKIEKQKEKIDQQKDTVKEAEEAVEEEKERLKKEAEDNPKAHGTNEKLQELKKELKEAEEGLEELEDDLDELEEDLQKARDKLEEKLRGAVDDILEDHPIPDDPDELDDYEKKMKKLETNPRNSKTEAELRKRIQDKINAKRKELEEQTSLPDHKNRSFTAPKWMLGGDYTDWYAEEIPFADDYFDALKEGIYSNAELTEKLLESLGGEFFIGSFSAPPKFEQYRFTNPRIFGMNTSIYFDRHFGIRLGAGKGYAAVSADFPITVIDLENGETQMVFGQVIHDRSFYNSFAQIQYVLFEGYLRMMFGAGVYYQYEKASTVDAMIGTERFPIREIAARSNWYPNAEVGFQLQLSNRLVAEASAKARKTETNIEYGAGVGLYFALVK
jgi:hypothetical protein